MRTRSLLTAAAAAVALAVTPTASASAAPSFDGGPKTANPAQACAAIPATLALLGASAPGFDHSACVRTVASRVPDVAFGSPYEQCAMLEAGVQTPGGFFKVTYPYTFHAEPGDPFPDLTAHNRTQCARALYAFHTIEHYLMMAPPPAP